MLAKVFAIQLLHEIDLPALKMRIDLRRWLQIDNRLASAPKGCSLVSRWHESCAPVGRTSDRAAAPVVHNDESRKIFIRTAEAIGDPGAERRIAGTDDAAVHLKNGGRVIVALGEHRANNRQIVNAGGYVGKEF